MYRHDIILSSGRRMAQTAYWQDADEVTAMMSVSKLLSLEFHCLP